MSDPIHSKPQKVHLSFKVLPSIISRHQDDIIELAWTALFLSLLFMIFFLPLYETWKNIGYGLAGLSALYLLYVYRDFGIKLYPAGWGNLVLLGAVCLSAVFAINFFQGLRGVWDVLRFFAVYLIVVNTFETKQQITLCITVFLISATIGSLWGLTEYYFGTREFLEIHSLGHKNHTATYLAIVLALCGGLMVTDVPAGLYRVFLAGVMVIVGWALLLTQSRAAWVALAIVYVTFLFLMRPRRARLMLGAFILFLALLCLSIQPIRARVVTLAQSPFQNETLMVRARSWQNTFRLIQDHPVFGVGPRNFNFIDHEKYNLVGWNHAHSLYVNTAAELGWVGLGALLGWLASCWVTLKAIRKRCHTNNQYGYWLAALGALLIIVVSGIVTTTLHAEGAIAFSLVLGIAVAATIRRSYKDMPQ